MEWEDWKDKIIFVKLKDGSIYNGKVISVDDPNSPVQFMNIKDKFDELVTFPISEIIKIVDQSSKGNGGVGE